jgi:cathepsin B
MSDRICIATEGRLQRHVSTEDIITCCSSCKTFSSGCGDGVHHEVWEFWIEEGIVSGGMYNSKEVTYFN